MAQQSNPLVSVIVPVYHTSEYLPQCLESLLNQTLEDLEILCVDDGSSDDSAEIAEEFSRRDSRVRLLRQEHQGVSAARNLGLRHARGTYIAFVDGDDWVEPDMLRTMIASAGETGSDVVVCSAKVHFQQQGDGTRERSLIRSLTTVPGTWEKDSGESVWQCMNRPGTWPFIWNKLISRELLTQKELEFPLGLPLGEDGVFMHLLMHCAGKVNYLPQAFYNYRYQRKDSATVRLFDQEITRFRHHIRVLDAMGRGFDRLHPQICPDRRTGDSADVVVPAR